MKSLFIIALAALARAKCDLPSGVGQWNPERGQTGAVVLYDLGIDEEEFKSLNPGVNIDLIYPYPDFTYKVPVKHSRSGEWTGACPQVLRIPLTSDTLTEDPSDEKQKSPETTAIVGADDEYRDQETEILHNTVVTETRATSVYGSDPSSPSIVSHSQPDAAPHQPSSAEKGSSTAPQGNAATSSMSDGPTGTTATATGTPSKDAEANRTYSNGSGHPEDAKASKVTQTKKIPEGSSATAEEPKVKQSSAAKDTTSPCATVSNEETGTSELPSLSSTATMAKSTDKMGGNGKILETTTTILPAPSSVTDGGNSGVALSSTPSNPYCKSEQRSGLSCDKEHAASSKGHPVQNDSGEAATFVPSTSAGTASQSQGSSTTTILADDTSTQPVSGGSQAKSTKIPTDQKSTTVTAALTATGTTLTTSSTPSYTGYAAFPASCKFAPDELGPGQSDSKLVGKMVMRFCEPSGIKNRMKDGDDCIRSDTSDSSDINYEFSICPINGCKDWGERPNDPVQQKGFSCGHIFYNKIWQYCKTEHSNVNGGHWTSACLEYSMVIGAIEKDD